MGILLFNENSYALYSDYLLTGNATKNCISTEYVVNSIKDEAKSFKELEYF